MLLVIDVGNTNTVIGTLKTPSSRRGPATVVHRWRITTSARTTDESGLLLLELLGHRGISPEAIEGTMISCVVPSTLYAWEKACRRYLSTEPMIVGRSISTGMRVRTDNPREVGADRIVNAVAAYAKHGCALVVVDFGTATTFDCVNDAGDYVGGAIAPGFRISADALFLRTAKLPRVEVERPKRAIGTNTIECIQSGLFWGYVGLVDGLARRCKEELVDQNTERSTADVPCVATGGMANLVGRSCEEIDEVDEDMTLRGLWILWDRNRRTRR